MQECTTLLDRLTDRLRENERTALRRRIEAAAAEHAGEEGPHGPKALRFLQDLDIYVNMPGPDFIYSLGVSGCLRVGEDIFYLANDLKHAER
ncbi:MAG: hypothetical protein H0S85_08075 [Desulfovibrionaceae bacterium]|jgi:hypothetical protein|nr:hypothetical protein [Desulfovibrionaceae bacterium]